MFLDCPLLLLGYEMDRMLNYSCAFSKDWYLFKVFLVSYCNHNMDKSVTKARFYIQRKM